MKDSIKTNRALRVNFLYSLKPVNCVEMQAISLLRLENHLKVNCTNRHNYLHHQKIAQTMV